MNINQLIIELSKVKDKGEEVWCLVNGDALRILGVSNTNGEVNLNCEVFQIYE